MGQYFDTYQLIADQDDILFRELIIGKTIKEVNQIILQKDYYYNSVLIKAICDGECSDCCDHDLIVDTKKGIITDIYMF